MTNTSRLGTGLASIDLKSVITIPINTNQHRITLRHCAGSIVADKPAGMNAAINRITLTNITSPYLVCDNRDQNEIKA